MLEKLRLMLRECNPPQTCRGDQLDIQKILDSSQGQLLVIQFESYTGRAAGVGLTSETSLHAQPEWKKAIRARAATGSPRRTEEPILLHGKTPGWPQIGKLSPLIATCCLNYGSVSWSSEKSQTCQLRAEANKTVSKKWHEV